MVLVQKWPFFQVCFLGNFCHENFFYDILERKNALLSYKNKKFKKSKKNDIFSKGLTHGCGRKMAILTTFFFRQYRPLKCLLRYPRKKNPFLSYKNKAFNKSKIDIFPKGLTHGFGAKMAIFPTLFFQAI